jgi:taurine dioxygenase
MIKVVPTGEVLGATVTGAELKQGLSKTEFAAVLRALGNHGVLRFPDQLISATELKRLSDQFGEVQMLGTSKFNEPGLPAVSILSNIVENGKPIGVPDAGQAWHTDMTYNSGGERGFVNILVAYAVPMRDGKPLGATEFTNTQAAYEGLPEDIKQRFADATAVHDYCKYWDMMRREKGSKRPALTPEERAAKPPVRHPVFLTHPITGRKVIYVNPGYVHAIDGLPADESARMLDYLFQHVLKPEYRYVHRWAVRDVLIWDHIGTWHNAVGDYGPNEPRLMKRCQVMANRIFDPKFVSEALAE